MRCLPLIPILMMALLLCASCASKDGATKTESTAEARSLSAAQPDRAGDAAPAPPKDAQWTIYCFTVKGPAHVAQANRMKDDLMRTTNLRGWYVVHQEEHSVLYYGYYRSFKDPKDPNETAKLQRDQKSIQAIADQTGNKPFREAMPSQIDSPDPVAPPEWDLKNAKGYWSIQIAAYQGSPQRKQAAVDSVREARKQGIEAYYYHGPSVSSVCIGAFPEEALKKQEADEAGAIDPDQPVLVLGPGTDVLGNQTKGLRERESGERVHVVEERVDVVDPNMLKIWREYPTHVVNGEEEMVSVRAPDGRTLRKPKPSVIVPIPRQTATVLSPGPAPDQPNLLNPSGEDDDLSRRLRSVGSGSGR